MKREDLVKLFDERSPNSEMSEEETMMMMGILMGENKELSIDINEIDKKSDLYNHFKPVFDAFVAKVFLGRLEALTTIKMSAGALVILMGHMPSAGAAVMYAFYLKHKLPENTLVTVETFGDVFPWGFFSERQLSEIWDGQKDGGANGIDDSSLWFEEEPIKKD